MRPGSIAIVCCHCPSAVTLNMWVLLLILSAVVPCLPSKEHTPLQDLPKDEKNIIFELVKRLEKGDDINLLDWKDELQCQVSTNKTSIIKKKDSLNNGAAFLTSYKNIENNEACSDLCCRNASCDMAVFENKGGHYCYLFRCEGKCKFGHHSSYMSNTISHHSHQAPADGSELDLIGLNSGSDSNSNDSDGSFKSTSVATATTSTTTTAVSIRAHSVGLEGHCEQDIHCEDPSAVCSSLTCLCKEGYYKKGHICRQVCPPSNFECLELGTLGRGPQCVPQAEVCDAVMQCADGSDEYNCPDSGGPHKETGVEPKVAKPTQKGASHSSDAHQVASSEGDKQAAQPAGDSAGGHHPDTDQASSSADSDDTNSSSNTDEGSQTETGEKQSSTSSDSAGSANSSSEKGGGSKDDSESTEDKESQKAGDGGNQSQNTFISREKMDLKVEPTSMQGPIIALSLGLAFTLILLVFVACRLRNVRRRLRKGRPLHSNEADYLINGMYL